MSIFSGQVGSVGLGHSVFGCVCVSVCVFVCSVCVSMRDMHCSYVNLKQGTLVAGVDNESVLRGKQ